MNLGSFNQLNSLLSEVQKLACVAGETIMNIYSGEFEIEHKADQTPLTTADLASNHLITEGLSQLNPVWPILSEESEHLPFQDRSSWQTYWLIDPLDGTREFIKHNGEFTVNIALINKHEPILGVVYAPDKNICYYAGRGLGSFKDTSNSQHQEIHALEHLRKVPVVAGSRSHGSQNLQQFLQRVGQYKLISMGSSLKSCLVAEGSADIYPRFGSTSEWDTAAAQCIVEEAGGRMTDLTFQPLRYNTKESLINPSFLVYAGRSTDWASYL